MPGNRETAMEAEPPPAACPPLRAGARSQAHLGLPEWLRSPRPLSLEPGFILFIFCSCGVGVLAVGSVCLRVFVLGARGPFEMSAAWGWRRLINVLGPEVRALLPASAGERVARSHCGVWAHRDRCGHPSVPRLRCHVSVTDVIPTVQ